MKTYGVCGVLGGLTALSLSLVVGCGDDTTDPPGKAGAGGSATAGSSNSSGNGGDDGGGSDAGGTKAGAGSEAGSGGTMAGGANGGSAGAVSGGSGGSGGSGVVEPPTFKSMPAGIELSLDAKSKDLGLTLASSSITQENTTSLHYVEWLGELYNGSKETQCLIGLTGDFQTAAGASIEKFDTFAYGPAYDLGASKLSSPCVAPGESVPIWSNDLPGQVLAIGTIEKLVVTITPLASPEAVLHPSTPSLSPVQQKYDDTFEAWQMSTTATSQGDIYNASITFWGKSGDFYVGNAQEYHLEDFPKGAVWAVDTAPLGIETPTLTKVVTYFSFIGGLKGSAARRLYDEKTSAMLILRDDAVTKWDAASARRDSARKLAQ